MFSVFLAEPAILADCQLVWRVLLVLFRVVIPLLALGACEDDVLTNAWLSHYATSIFSTRSCILAHKKNDLWANKQCILPWTSMTRNRFESIKSKK